MAILAVAQTSLAGVALGAVAAAGGGDSFQNDGATALYVKNGSGAPITVTADAPNADNFGIIDNAHDSPATIAAGAERLLGPFPPGRFNDANGRVQLTYSGVTSLTVAPFRIG